MASNKFAISATDDYTDTAVSSTSDPTDDVEVVIKTGTSVETAFLCLEKIKDFLLRRGTT